MTFLTPILIAGVYGLIGYLSYKGIKDRSDRIAVVSENKSIQENLLSDDKINYAYYNGNLDKAKAALKNEEFDFVLYIPDFDINAKPIDIQLFGYKQASISVESRISRDLESLIKNQKLILSGINQSQLDALETDVDLSIVKIGETGSEKGASAGASAIIGGSIGIFMFVFIMLYGVQVMRGVIEEKTNRIIEIMISSVKPFQLMMGKIIGIGLVSLTQFLLWIVLTTSLSGAAVSFFASKDKSLNQVEMSNPELNKEIQAELQKAGSNPVMDIQKSLSGIPLGKIVALFIFYFLTGYLFYSALYAAIGSAVDNETETQQFMMPVMLPLFFSYFLSLTVVNNDPHGSLAFWLSMIPFTSPIAMAVRIPYEVPTWQLALSMALLVVGFIATTWLAGRIYRVGILMYGKKPTFKELFKWLKYKS